jgi:hypothetical protein
VSDLTRQPTALFLSSVRASLKARDRRLIILIELFPQSGVVL